jgi:hypothetical protein
MHYRSLSRFRWGRCCLRPLRQVTINGARQWDKEGSLGEVVPKAFANLLFS